MPLGLAAGRIYRRWSGRLVALAAPVLFAPVLHVGWRVDRAHGAYVCIATDPAACARGEPTARPGGFSDPVSVATDPRSGVLYVADLLNARVQAFAPTGALQPAVSALAGFAHPVALAVDPDSGDLYLREGGSYGASVEKLEPSGEPVWIAGAHVDPRTGANLCRSQAPAANRQDAATAGWPWGSAPRPFGPAIQPGDLLAVGGSRRLLYVADEHRVQEFEPDGRWRGEILLVSLSAAATSSVSAIAVGPEGDVYLVYESPGTLGQSVRTEVVRRFDPAGTQVGELPVRPRLAGEELHVDGIAVDRNGRLR